MDALGSDIGSQLIAKHALAETAVTAGGQGDAAEIVGTVIDLTALPSRPRSCKFLVPCEATLTTAKTLVVAGKVDVSHNNSTWVNLVASATLLTLTAALPGPGVAAVNAKNLQANVPGTANPIRYVRLSVTPDLSHTTTDTAKIGGGVAVFGGQDFVPQADPVI